jgi:isopenicillin N synthase-like dioxygenase
MPGFHAPNTWPKLPEDQFRRPTWDYYNAVHKLGRTIWEMLVIGLGQSPSILERYATRPIVSLKMIRYPPSSQAQAGQFGVGPHTDFGGVTVLLQQPGREGLEVFHEGRQEWLAVPAPEDTFVVNVGNMISQWSGQAYKSPLHRVINKSGGERISVALFWHGDVDATNPLNPSDPDRSTVGDLLVRRFRKQFVLPEKVDITPKTQAVETQS